MHLMKSTYNKLLYIMGLHSNTQAAGPRICKILFYLLSPVLYTYLLSERQPSHLAHTVWIHVYDSQFPPMPGRKGLPKGHPTGGVNFYRTIAGVRGRICIACFIITFSAEPT